jgi:hypothetical protein
MAAEDAAATAALLPELSSPYRLSPAQIAQFRKNGHVRLPAVCSPAEVEAYGHIISREAFGVWDEAGATGQGRHFLQTLNLRHRHPGILKYVLAERFGRIVAELIGCEAVRIFHEQALFKEGGGGPTPWHQDQYYWPIDTMAVGMWMPLVDVSKDMGPIRFASGSFHDGYLGPHPISDESQQHFEEYVSARGFPRHVEAMKAGDATFHNAFIVHGASANLTAKLRAAMVVTFYPDGTRCGELLNPSRAGDAKTFLGGKAPGELCDNDETNPIVYDARRGGGSGRL